MIQKIQKEYSYGNVSVPETDRPYQLKKTNMAWFLRGAQIRDPICVRHAHAAVTRISEIRTHTSAELRSPNRSWPAIPGTPIEEIQRAVQTQSNWQASRNRLREEAFGTVSEWRDLWVIPGLGTQPWHSGTVPVGQVFATGGGSRRQVSRGVA